MNHLIFCGSLAAMKQIAARGVRGLNPKTMRWQIVSKTAQYEVVETDRFVGSDGQECVCANLMCNEDLRQTAKDKGLILS